MSLDQQLRDYVDDAASPVAFDEIISGGATARASGLRRRRTLVAAVALVALGVGVGLLTWDRSGLESVSTSANRDDLAAVAEPPVQPDVASSQFVARQIDPDSAWAQVGDTGSLFETTDDATASGTSDIRVNSMVELPSGFFAVGAEVIDSRALGAIWRSADGETWERVTGVGDLFGTLDHELGDIWPSGIELDGIVERQGVIVVAGTDTRTGGTPVAFRSVDGDRWESTPIEAPGATLTSIQGVVATPDAFVIVGFDNTGSLDFTNNATLVWRSLDGRTWDRLPGPQIELGALPVAAAVVGGRIVVVGSTGVVAGPTGLTGEAAAWTSDDGGLTWSRSTVSAGDSDLAFSAMADVASGADGLLAVGERFTEQTEIQGDADGMRVIGERDLAVWWSADGTSWTEQTVVDLPESLEFKNSLVSGPAGFLIATESWASDAATNRIWVTNDGSDLVTVQAPETGSIGALLATSDGYSLVAGETNPFDSTPQSLVFLKLPTT